MSLEMTCEMIQITSSLVQIPCVLIQISSVIKSLKWIGICSNLLENKL